MSEAPLAVEGARSGDEAAERDRWIELAVVFVMSFTAVLTAWAGYQSAKWSGEQSAAYAHASALRTRSSTASTTAGQQQGLDVATFIAWVEAVADDDRARADFASERFSPRLQPAVEAWLATDPLQDPDAPPTPFTMEEYRVPAMAEAEELAAAADAAAADAGRAAERIDRYVIMTVLFATVLFFAAFSSKLRSRRNRIVILDVALAGFAVGLVLLLASPVRW